MTKPISYKSSGVDISAADEAKRKMAESLKSKDIRVLTGLGAFASLFEASFPGYKEPVLALKMEEPGSKQKLALDHGRVESLCEDLIHHLINDIAVMGALPLVVLDAIICGHLEKDVVGRIVKGLSKTCQEQGCTLVGGETSEQPGILPDKTYILTASILGVVEKSKIIDGQKIQEGDILLGVASNGLHTNGYSLVRALIKEEPELLKVNIEGESFLDLILRPHVCYLQALKGIFDHSGLHGMAHITGGGLPGNVNRIIPKGLCAEIQVSTISVLPVFKFLRGQGGLDDQDMLRTFNLGVGLVLVCDSGSVASFQNHFRVAKLDAYPIGKVVKGEEKVKTSGMFGW